MNDIEFGEEVRRQGHPETAGRSMKDLVYNPVTGEFEQVARGESNNSQGTVVTEMTEQGFAA